jgi:hypothetical protein
MGRARRSRRSGRRGSRPPTRGPAPAARRGRAPPPAPGWARPPAAPGGVAHRSASSPAAGGDPGRPHAPGRRRSRAPAPRQGVAVGAGERLGRVDHLEEARRRDASGPTLMRAPIRRSHGVRRVASAPTAKAHSSARLRTRSGAIAATCRQTSDPNEWPTRWAASHARRPSARACPRPSWARRRRRRRAGCGRCRGGRRPGSGDRSASPSTCRAQPLPPGGPSPGRTPPRASRPARASARPRAWSRAPRRSTTSARRLMQAATAGRG